MAKKWTAELDCVGLRFRWTRDGRIMLKNMAESYIAGIRLIREPENKYDSNAIAVYLPKRLMDGKQLGYLSRQVAEKLAPALDSGRTTVAKAVLDGVSGQDDDYNTATLLVTFKDKPQTRTVKPKAANTKSGLTKR